VFVSLTSSGKVLIEPLPEDPIEAALRSARKTGARLLMNEINSDRPAAPVGRVLPPRRWL
jgi:hypothetical protein